jgi:GNAT superfamily N-acetyltransferase
VHVFSLEHGGLMAEIDEFFVLPAARAQGVGGQLLAAAEQALRQRGGVRLQLQLAVANTAARSFYERRGYGGRAGYQLLEKAL